MDYEEEIKKHFEEIQRLSELRNAEYMKNIGNLIGLCLKPSATSRYKILSIDEARETTADCTIIDVYKNEDSTEARISNSGYNDFTIPITANIQIISQEEFDAFLNEAIEVINKTNKSI